MISAKKQKIQDERIERKWKFYFIQWVTSDILSHFFNYGSINLAKRVIATPPSIKVLPSIGIKMYKCSLCENEFAWRANLTRHMSAHTGEKTYNCNQCDFATAWPSNLNKHLKIHSGVRSHKCIHCDFASHQAGNLRTHLKIHIRDNLKKCDQCGYATVQASNLQ